MKLSVVIITLNEEDRLEDALISCGEIADEVVVLDSHSIDDTVAIAQQHGAKVFFRKFDDYGAQKNAALDHAQHNWVLNLDADERVSDTLKSEILKLKELNEEDIDAAGFEIKRKTAYLGRWITHSGWYPDRKLRLFRKDKSRWHGRIHEGLKLEGIRKRMAGDILHFTYRDMTDHINRLNRYSHMQAQDIAAKGKKMLYLRTLILPPITFLRFYVWKLGILDGLPGFVIALVSSWGTAMKYLKAIEIKRLRPQSHKDKKAGGPGNPY
jgi:glycosyltransferase involved in cell wall biosynthesis